MKKIFKKYYYEEIISKWLVYKSTEIKESTYAKYFYIASNYILDKLGKINFKKLSEKDIYNFFNNNDIRKLSDATKKHILYVIQSSINYGIEKGYRKSFNKLNIKIKKSKARTNYLTKNEQQTLEKFLLNDIDINKLGITMCLYTGIRLGELCALKWDSIDFSNNILLITQTTQRIKNLDINAKSKTKLIITSPKSEYSIRTIPLPIFLIELLKKFKSNSNYYIFSNSGIPRDPRTFEKYFAKILKQLNIRSLEFHTLRHTFATRSIESNMEIKTLSEILGHSSYHITLDIYVHSSLELKRDSLSNLVNYMRPNGS